MHLTRPGALSRSIPAQGPSVRSRGLRSLAGCKESQQWSCIASTGLARQEVDDSKEVTSLTISDALEVRPGPLHSGSLPCVFA